MENSTQILGLLNGGVEKVQDEDRRGVKWKIGQGWEWLFVCPSLNNDKNVEFDDGDNQSVQVDRDHCQTQHLSIMRDGKTLPVHSWQKIQSYSTTIFTLDLPRGTIEE